jgi:5-methyltetrahydrofolate--homocysteine methyltransferase
LNQIKNQPAPLEFKPDLADAARRWEAYLAGEILDRPLVMVRAPKPGKKTAPGSTYRDRAFGDLDPIIDNALLNAEATFYGGEAIPSFWLSFGPDEIAVFCGSELVWPEDKAIDTNWSKPWVEDWAAALPLKIHEDHPLWRRMIDFYRRAAARMAGKMLLSHIDLHSNMDILAPIRGTERLCMDLIDQPEMIDRAMASARALFPKIWRTFAEAGRMDERGYCFGLYSMDGAATLQCDFSCMVSPAMFRRWILPALEEEASIVKHAYYHWDGPGALKFFDDLMAAKDLHTFSYVPNPNQIHLHCLDLFQRIQAAGKSVHFWGSAEEIKQAHPHLRPEKTMYSCGVGTPAEAEALLEWFVKHT